VKDVSKEDNSPHVFQRRHFVKAYAHFQRRSALDEICVVIERVPSFVLQSRIQDS
jgi:hypothetical protein